MALAQVLEKKSTSLKCVEIHPFTRYQRLSPGPGFFCLFSFFAIGLGEFYAEFGERRSGRRA